MDQLCPHPGDIPGEQGRQGWEEAERPHHQAAEESLVQGRRSGVVGKVRVLRLLSLAQWSGMEAGETSPKCTEDMHPVVLGTATLVTSLGRGHGGGN